MHDDLKELIESLIAAQVEFIVVGSTVLAFYGRARYTEDIDLWIRPTVDNVERLIAALTDFGLPVKAEAFESFHSETDQMIVLGAKPQAVDLLNQITGLEWDGSWQRASSGEFEGVHVKFLSLIDFVRAKMATGRPKDVADLEVLRESLGSLPDVHE